MNKSDEINEIVKALAKVQSEIQNPKKDANNPFFKSKYSTLDNVIDAYKDLCSKNDLVVLENPVSKVDENGKVLVGIEVQIMHASGQFLSFDPYLLSPVKNDPQGIGSGVTYARRYTLSSVFNIASEEDDDGNSASQNNKQNSQQSNQPQTNNKMASEKQLGLLHYKSKELADLHSMGHDELKVKLGIKTGMSEIDFKQVLKRVTDGIEKAQKQEEK